MRKIALISSIEDQNHAPRVGYYIAEDLNHIGCNSNQLQPALLTNQWLEESGFLFNTYFNLWQKLRSGNGKGMEMELDHDYNVVDFMRRPIVKEIKSRHILQNLYYALLGKELVKIPVQAMA